MIPCIASSKYPYAHPPCSNPPLRSSPGAPGACITPSTETNGTATSELISPPSTSMRALRDIDPPHVRPPDHHGHYDERRTARGDRMGRIIVTEFVTLDG